MSVLQYLAGMSSGSLLLPVVTMTDTEVRTADGDGFDNTFIVTGNWTENVDALEFTTTHFEAGSQGNPTPGAFPGGAWATIDTLASGDAMQWDNGLLHPPDGPASFIDFLASFPSPQSVFQDGLWFRILVVAKGADADSLPFEFFYADEES